jgi:hypothetical protein
MPRLSDGGGAPFRIPGCYEKLLAGGCRERRRLDPRLELVDMSQGEREVWDWLRAERVWQAQQDLAERLASGEPFELPRWYFGGHSIPRQDSWPAWLRPGSSVRSVRVFPDDTIEPVR